MTTATILPEQYVGISTASRIIGVSEPTVRAWADRGLIGCTRVAGRRILLVEDVKKVAAQRARRLSMRGNGGHVDERPAGRLAARDGAL